VNCDNHIGFFPDIYNEDWFFFFDAASEGRLGNSCLKATQLVYYPFANAERAAWQEFGDVVAEGLYALLHLKMDIGQATSAYWAHFLEARRNFLEATLSRAEQAPPDMRDEIVASLHRALKCLGGITPDLCARYVEAWRHDREDWKRRWAEIEVMPSAAAALAELGLPTPTDTTKRLLHPQDRPARPLTPGRVTIPRFDTLREMADRYSAHHLGSPVHDEKRSALRRDHRRYRRLSQVNDVIAVAHMAVIYCQLRVIRIFSLRRLST